MTSIVSKWHENCSLFRFLSSQSAKNYRFFSMKFYEPQKYKIFTFYWWWMRIFFFIFISLNFLLHFLEVETVVRWDTYHFTQSYCPLFSGIKEIIFKNPTDNYLKFSSSFSAIHSNVFHAAPLQEQNHIKQLKIKHLTINKLPRIMLCTCFCRWLQYFPAENTKFSSQENNCFLPREFYARYENTLHSLREWSAFQ